MILDDCIGCGAPLRDTDLDCIYCRRPNPFALARQAAKAIEVTQLDDYAPRFVYEFGSSLTEEEAREFASMWAKHQSSPQGWIPSPPAVDGAYALPPVEPFRPKQPTGYSSIPRRNGKHNEEGRSLIGRLISKLFR